MADGFDALQGMIDTLRELPGEMRAAAPEAAEAVADEVRAQISRGTDATGAAWEPTAEGKQPLTNAAASLRVVTVGSQIFLRLVGPVARHHRGRAKGGIVRAIFPKAGTLPPKYIEALKRAFSKRFAATVGQ